MRYTDGYNTVKYKNRPAKDNVTDLLRYTDGPRFRDEVIILLTLRNYVEKFNSRRL
jgi:hypothetical protein